MSGARFAGGHALRCECVCVCVPLREPLSLVGQVSFGAGYCALERNASKLTQWRCVHVCTFVGVRGVSGGVGVGWGGLGQV